ncbi:hypothetical protein NDU88_005168 [Pleurodeles waltl]|uniref:Uncharacterized protein n=1 Tax=Pleurodeles waltl TaxID=8319 RepID=A0AAV7SKX4_PLEWA|nr:hypothetical protein NDU88_005168 [Pleurodeles waltl]
MFSARLDNPSRRALFTRAPVLGSKEGQGAPHAARATLRAAARRSGSEEPAVRLDSPSRLASPLVREPQVSAPEKAPRVSVISATTPSTPFSDSRTRHFRGASDATCAACPVSRRCQTGYMYGPKAEPEFRRPPWLPS